MMNLAISMEDRRTNAHMPRSVREETSLSSRCQRGQCTNYKWHAKEHIKRVFVPHTPGSACEGGLSPILQPTVSLRTTQQYKISPARLPNKLTVLMLENVPIVYVFLQRGVKNFTLTFFLENKLTYASAIVWIHHNNQKIQDQYRWLFVMHYLQSYFIFCIVFPLVSTML